MPRQLAVSDCGMGSLADSLVMKWVHHDVDQICQFFGW